VYEHPLDVSMFAMSMGASAYRCHRPGDVQEAVQAALQASGPTVIEVMVDPLEIPPILTRLLSMA
jgi:acetolactate synthase-1/2/3 large subunit